MSKQQQNHIEAAEPQEQQAELSPTKPEPSIVDPPATPLENAPVSEAPPSSDASAPSETEQAEPVAATPGKKRARKRGRWVSAEEVMPRPSYWPIALAFALIVLLLGVMLHPLVIVFGALLTLGTLVGWIFERR